MIRILELIQEVRVRYPTDDFFADFEETCASSPLKQRFYQAYEDALHFLNPISWSTLKAKAIEHFRDHRSGQLKAGLFNQLNEAFAYKYLVELGCSDIKFLPEGKSKQADIGFLLNQIPGLCEVKSIGISDNEIKRRESHDCFDGSIYSELTTEFFAKLSSTIQIAQRQITPHPSTSFVFVIIEFDDFTHDYLPEYLQQLQAFKSPLPAGHLVFQVGRFGHTINA